MKSRNARAIMGTKKILDGFSQLTSLVNSSGEQLIIDTNRDLEEREIAALEKFELESDIILKYNGKYEDTDYLLFTVEHP